MLLISRVRDESPHGVRSGVIRAVGSTGRVITSAGVIVAASMFGLLFGSITGVVQVGFIIGVRTTGHLSGADHLGARDGRAVRPGELVAHARGATSVEGRRPGRWSLLGGRRVHQRRRGRSLRLAHQAPSGRSAQNRRAKGSVTGRANELFKNGRTGLWNMFIVCPGAPKPSVGSTPEVKVSVNSGLEKTTASKKWSSGSERAVSVAEPKLMT